MKITPKSIIIAVVLIVLVALNFTEYSSDDSAGSDLTIKQMKQEIKNLRFAIHLKKKKKLLEKSKISVVEDNLDYFWQESSSNNISSLTIRNIIQQMARRGGMTLSNVGSPRDLGFSDNIGQFQTTVSSRSVYLKDVAKFLQVVDRNKPAFFWSRLELRPDRRNPGKVDLTGSLVTYYLTKESTKIVSPSKPVGTKNKRGIKQ
ncbi:MAG: hypothetical protein KAG98_01300 [Lentisphaeria bacterium]|nr:hypothetical protein [Lentisphaeria bacterium]